VLCCALGLERQCGGMREVGGGSLDHLAPTHGTELRYHPSAARYRAGQLMGATGVVTGKQVEENEIGRESSMHWVMRTGYQQDPEVDGTVMLLWI